MKYESIGTFLKPDHQTPCIDVRSPSEFASGHIPGARNIPLFSDDERHRIGIIYKEEGKQAAVKEGLSFVGPRLKGFIESMESIANHGRLKFYCWRGGMRSSSMAWLADTAGFETTVLTGGYKSYRRLMESIFTNYRLVLLAGETGSGKTKLLHALAKMGHQVIDLEGLAQHRGSAFGSVGQPPQPTSEHFQNLVIHAFLQCDTEQLVFVEDESSSIGKVGLPPQLWKQMSGSALIRICLPREARVQFLVEAYGQEDKEELATGIQKISKKLGGLATREALNDLNEGNMAAVADAMLVYYDKSYQFLLDRKSPNIIGTIRADTLNIPSIALKIVELSKSMDIIQT